MGLGSAIGGGLSAIGGLGSAIIGSGASQQASQQQSTLGLLGLIAQQQQFAQAQGALKPYYTAGQNVLPTLQSLLTPGPSQTATLSQLPGFQFQSQWGNIAATNALAAQGLGGSTGPLAKAISDYNNGLAGTYWQNEVGALQNFANTGANAASSLAGNAVASGNAQAQTLGSIGNALASGTLGSANAISGGITTGANALGNAALLNGLLGGGGSNTTLGGIYGNITGQSFVPNASWGL